MRFAAIAFHSLGSLFPARPSQLRESLRSGADENQTRLRGFHRAREFLQERGSACAPGVSGDWWVGEAQEFLRTVGADIGMSWGALCAAVIATGDILFTDPSQFPYIDLGLARGSRQHPYKPIYREILAGERAFLPAVDKPRARPFTGCRPKQPQLVLCGRECRFNMTAEVRDLAAHALELVTEVVQFRIAQARLLQVALQARKLLLPTRDPLLDVNADTLVGTGNDLGRVNRSGS